MLRLHPSIADGAEERDLSDAAVPGVGAFRAQAGMNADSLERTVSGMLVSEVREALVAQQHQALRRTSSAPE